MLQDNVGGEVLDLALVNSSVGARFIVSQKVVLDKGILLLITISPVWRSNAARLLCTMTPHCPE